MDLRAILAQLMAPSQRQPQSFEELLQLTGGDRDAAARRWNIQRGNPNSTAYSPSMEAAPAAPDPMQTASVVPTPAPRPAPAPVVPQQAPIPMARPGTSEQLLGETKAPPPVTANVPIPQQRPELAPQTGPVPTPRPTSFDEVLEPLRPKKKPKKRSQYTVR